ncbi:MAG: S8 family serine peptidase [Bacteroidales bacterium]|nr:S8 family serine peptidase [Bacteroidales bacterium]
MNRNGIFRLKWTICFLCWCAGAGLQAQSTRRVHAGKVLVKLQVDAVPAIERHTRSRLRSDTAVVVSGLASFDRLNRRYRAVNMRRLFPDAGKYEAKHRKYGLHLWYEMTIPETLDPEHVAREYKTDGHIQFSEPVYRIRSLSAPATVTAPDDPNFSKQWHFNNTGQTGGVPGVDIRLLNAWKKIDSIGIRNHNVVVAVVDGGVNYDHEDLNANMWTNEAELNGVAGVDDDDNGYTDDIYGYNFVRRRGTIQPEGAIQPEDHATHVAATIAAVTDNAKGVSGMTRENYGVKVMNVQILLGEDGVVSLAPAFAYAADNGAVISQNSWGYENPGEYNESDIEAINYFIAEAGKDEEGNPRDGTPMTGGIVIFAAGNDGTSEKWYPGYFDNVIAVGAVNHYGRRTSYSNFGAWVDIAAPGGESEKAGGRITKEEGCIYSASYRLNNHSYYEYKEGTSMACPQVSGTAALVLAVHGNRQFTPDMLRYRLLGSATPLSIYDHENYEGMGSGLVNAEKAIAAEGTPQEITDLTATPVNHISARLSWTVPPVSDNGDVAYFVVACSTSEITSDNFARYAGYPVPSSLALGQRQEHVISGLQPQTTYHVAIRSIGNFGDQSETSNVVTFTTNDNHPPEIRLFTDTTLIPNTPVDVDLLQYISDADADSLYFTVSMASSRLADATVQGNILTVSPKFHGEATLFLSACDPYSESTATVRLHIEQKYAPQKSGRLFVYPNPTDGQLFYSIVVNGEKPVAAFVRICDTSGRVLYENTPEMLPPGNHYRNIDVSTWLPGVYILQYYKNNEKSDALKFIKR